VGIFAAWTSVAPPPEVVVANLARAGVVGTTSSCPCNQAQVVRVAAFVAALADALDEVITNSIGPALGRGPVHHLWLLALLGDV